MMIPGIVAGQLPSVDGAGDIAHEFKFSDIDDLAWQEVIIVSGLEELPGESNFIGAWEDIIAVDELNEFAGADLADNAWHLVDYV